MSSINSAAATIGQIDGGRRDAGRRRIQASTEGKILESDRALPQVLQRLDVAQP